MTEDLGKPTEATAERRRIQLAAFALPLVLTLFVVSHFYFTNFIEVRFSELAFTTLVLLGFLAGLQVLLLWWLRDAERVGLVTAVAVFCFFSHERFVYGYYRLATRAGTELALVGTADPPQSLRVAFIWLMLAGVVLVAWLLFRVRWSLAWLVRFGFRFSVAALALSLAFGAMDYAQMLKPRLPVPPAHKSVHKPDIYLIVLDAFGRQDVLEKTYGFSPAPFLDFLRGQGFRVFSQARANYPTTAYSLASELNYCYLDPESTGVPTDYKSAYPLYPLAVDNRVGRFLRDEQGYEVINIYGGAAMTRCYTSTTQELGCPRAINGFFYVFFKHSPIEVLWSRYLTLPELDLRRQVVLEGLEALRTLPPRGDRPRFVTLHVLCPHHPFFLRTDGGRPHQDPNFDWEGTTRYSLGYAGQAEFLEARLQEILPEVMRKSQEPPVILIHGDHGPVPQTSDPDEQLRQRYPNLCALYLPDGDYSGLPEDLSPVNYFRVILNRYFETELELLPNRSFYQDNMWRYFEFTDITDKLNGKDASPSERTQGVPGSLSE